MNSEPRTRLAAFRSRSGKSPVEIEDQSGISDVSYYDLESTDDLYDAISLRDLSRVCSVVGCAPRDLFMKGAGNAADERGLSFPGLRERLLQYLNSHAIPLPEFEESVGWGLADFIHDPEVAWGWNVRCLSDVCAPLGVDWVRALPASSAPSG